MTRRRMAAAVAVLLALFGGAAGGAAIIGSVASASPTVEVPDHNTISCTTNSQGYCTVNHQLSVPPQDVTLTPVEPYRGFFGWDQATSSSFRIHVQRPSNSGPYAGPVTFSYVAYPSPAPVPPTTTPATTTPAPTTTAPATTTPAPTTTAPATTTPAPTTTAPAAGWPDGTNTGVPAGTTLSAYTGPCTITTANTVIDAKDATACGMILIHAAGVTITRSKLPVINATDGSTANYTVSVSDSTVSAPGWSEGALWGFKIIAARVNVTGGQHSFHCNDHCTLTDSWLHGQYNPSGQGYHNNAFITNGGTDMTVRHNTLHCDAILNSTNGGCTADVSLFGDFDPVSHVTIENNLLKANNSSISYCAYGGYEPAKNFPVSTYIVFKDNVFERGANNKCGVFGPVTSFQATATGNQWINNRWDDGTVLNP